MYISQYSFSKILELDFADSYLEEKLYLTPIYFLSEYEINKLLKIKYVLQLKDHKKIVIKSKKTGKSYVNWVEVSNKLLYHFNQECEIYQRENINKVISNRIRDVKDIALIRKRFEVDPHNLWNSFCGGLTDFIGSPKNNYNYLSKRKSLIKSIDEVIKLSRLYYFDSDTQRQSAIKIYGKRSYLHSSYFEINDNQTGLTDIQLRNHLERYDSQVVEKAKLLLKSYYRSLHNPELEYEESLLIQIGFKCCLDC